MDAREGEVKSVAAAPRPIDRASRELSFTRRALVKAGWSIPVIAAIEMFPANAHAIHSDTTENFIDGIHGDGGIHGDQVIG
jgi:hypothetical protein